MTLKQGNYALEITPENDYVRIFDKGNTTPVFNYKDLEDVIPLLTKAFMIKEVEIKERKYINSLESCLKDYSHSEEETSDIKKDIEFSKEKIATLYKEV